MKRYLFSILFLTTIHFSVFASVIKGKVADAETGELLVGCTVYITELTAGTFSGLDGSYILKDIPAGNYTLKCSYISYETITKEIILPNDNEIVTFDFQLQTVTTELNEVAVYGHSDKSTESSARSSERNSTSVMNVMSARSIEISPDLDIANVVQRMSGITLDVSSSGDAKYALMRGMDKRYNYTLVNGVKIPSTDNKHRYVSLDLFPSDMVNRVEVTKALTPDMEGDAIAGAVNLVMKDAPDKFLVQANLAAGYNFFFNDNEFVTFDKSVLNKKSPYEINGKGYYAQPSEFPEENLKFISNEVPLDKSIGLTLGNRIFNKKLGIVVSGTYLNSYKGKTSLRFDQDVEKNDISRMNLPMLDGMKERIYIERKDNSGIHGKLDYFITPRQRIKLYSSYINLASTQVREQESTNLSVSYDPDNGSISRSHSTRFRYNTRDLIVSMLQGDHNVGENLFLDWSLVYSKATNLTPDEASISYNTNLQNYQPYNWFVDFDGSNRVWRHNTDQDKSTYFNLKYTNRLFGYKTYFKIGGLYRKKQRESFYNSYTLQAIVPVNTPDTSYTSFYAEKGVDWNTYTDINWRVYNPRGTIATGENFESHEYVKAAYAMFDIRANKLQVTGGVRIENTEQGYFMEYPIGQPRPDGKQGYTDILPSLHIKYGFMKNQNLRISYYKATNKPGFLEIVPCPVIDDEDLETKGNPDLKHATADNYDIRWEYFPTQLDQVLIGFFYKNIKFPIERAYIREGSSQRNYYSPINADNCINKGIEVDVIKYFRVFGIKGNYTFTLSDITTDKLAYYRNENGDLVPDHAVSQKRPLYGQSQHAGNISLLYKGLKNKINAQLAFSYTGDRIYTVSQYIDNDLWQKGFWQLDASFDKKFKNGISIYVKVHNLLNTRLYGYIKKVNDHNGNFPYHEADDNDTMVRRDYSSQSILTGIKFKLKK